MKNKFGPILLIVILVSLIGTITSAIFFDRENIVYGVNNIHRELLNIDDFDDFDGFSKVFRGDKPVIKITPEGKTRDNSIVSGGELDKVKDIKIELNNGNIEIEKGTQNRVEVEDYFGERSVSNDTLTIVGNTGDIKITLANPELINVKINGNHLDLDVDCELKTFKSEINNLDAEFESINKYPIKVKSNYAEIKLSKNLFDNINVTSKGQVNINDMGTSRIINSGNYFDKGDGSVEITLNKGKIN